MQLLCASIVVRIFFYSKKAAQLWTHNDCTELQNTGLVHYAAMNAIYLFFM